ncbi:MAG: ABC transporter permease [Peptococcaceae bacterium]|nr:ABC transporter permease [Peptococcaceae bacterium]
MSDDKVGIVPKVVAVLVFGFLMAPLVVIILASFSPTTIVTFPPRGFSLEWYANIFGSSTNFVSGFFNSIKVAVIATVADIFLGVTAALAVSRYRFKGRELLVAFFTSPMYVPSIAFGFVLLQVFSAIGSIPAFLRILLGHGVIILPYILRNTLAVLASFNWTLEDAAASLGANPLQTFFKITLPLVKPGVVAGALLSFLYSFDEAVLSSLLNSPKFITLPIRIMNYMEFSFDPTLAAISTVLILLSFMTIVLLERFMGLDMFLK